MLGDVIQVQVDKEEFKKYMQNMFQEELRGNLETYWLIDIKKMSELTCMSVRFLEDAIVSDPRMRLIEIKKNRKRWWSYQEAMKIIFEITSEW